ncbi:MAG: endonuclease/exonuclease/phosphatase family protein [Alphaproteobacteria bacterium]|nr:endonuclease/exonuclease/phosphatase family protein [Alphaproteobacteria bacterium]
MKIASYNIHKCRGTDGLVRPDRIVAVIKEIGADLVALQEVDHRLGTRTGLLDPDHIESETGLKLLTQSDIVDGHGWHGNALLVRGTPSHYRRLRVHLPGIEPRGAVFAELDLGQGPFRVIAVHLGLLRHSRLAQTKALLDVFLGMAPLPTIMLGDFNEWRRARRSALARLETVFGARPAIPSFPSRLPVLPMDRMFDWPPSLITRCSVHDTRFARIASDHLPLVAEVNLDCTIPAQVHKTIS